MTCTCIVFYICFFQYILYCTCIDFKFVFSFFFILCFLLVFFFISVSLSLFCRVRVLILSLPLSAYYVAYVHYFYICLSQCIRVRLLIYVCLSLPILPCTCIVFYILYM